MPRHGATATVGPVDPSLSVPPNLVGFMEHFELAGCVRHLQHVRERTMLLHLHQKPPFGSQL